MKNFQYVILMVIVIKNFGANAQIRIKYDEGPVKADTIYYPFHNGKQLVVFDHLSYYEIIDLQYMDMSQAPYQYRDRPIGNEYFIRDSFGTIVKSFNSNQNIDSLANELRPLNHINSFNHHFKNFDYRGPEKIFFEVYNYTIQEYDPNDTAVIDNLKLGIIDTFGRLLIPIEFQEIRLINNCFLLRKNDKWGLTDSEFNYLIPNKYKSYRDYGSFIYFIKDNRYAHVFNIITYKQKNLEDLSLSTFDEKRGLLVFEKDNKSGLINVLTNEILISCDFDRIVTYFDYNDWMRLTYGYVIVIKNKKYGLETIEGKTILPCIYDRVYDAYESGRNQIKVEFKGEVREIEHHKRLLTRYKLH